jgi:hypothetical protein
MSQTKPEVRFVRDVLIPSGKVQLGGELNVPAGASGVVLFAHGSGSSRHSPRNKYVARTLQDAGVGTLLFDLLTREEEEEEKYTRHLRFDIALLSRRLVDATNFKTRLSQICGSNSVRAQGLQQRWSRKRRGCGRRIAWRPARLAGASQGQGSDVADR